VSEQGLTSPPTQYRLYRRRETNRKQMRIVFRKFWRCFVMPKINMHIRTECSCKHC